VFRIFFFLELPLQGLQRQPCDCSQHGNDDADLACSGINFWEMFCLKSLSDSNFWFFLYKTI